MKLKLHPLVVPAGLLLLCHAHEIYSSYNYTFYKKEKNNLKEKIKIKRKNQDLHLSERASPPPRVSRVLPVSHKHLHPE
jgi:hypothetical protein